MRRLAALTLFITSLFTLAFLPSQQSAVEFVNFSQDFTFGEQLIFTGTIKSPSSVTEAVLFLKPSGAATETIPFKPSSTGEVKLTVDLNDYPLRAFTPLDYWYQVKLAVGDPITSPTYTFVYEDNRYQWQQLNSEAFSLSWAEGGVEFGTDLENAAIDSLAASQAILAVKIPAPIRIVVYPRFTIDAIRRPVGIPRVGCWPCQPRSRVNFAFNPSRSGCPCRNGTPDSA